MSEFRYFIERQWIGVVFASRYLSLRGPAHRPYFSERNRISCRVLPLGSGWRIVWTTVRAP